jgi:hypothetical protein
VILTVACAVGIAACAITTAGSGSASNTKLNQRGKFSNCGGGGGDTDT